MRQNVRESIRRPEIDLALVRANAAAGGGTTPNPSWFQSTWFVDPQNASGFANDNNSGLTALSPVRTWEGGVIKKMMTYAPRLRQDTTVTFLSGHTDNTDPVIFNPFIENGALITVQGVVVTPFATGTLGTVTPKNRTTNTLLSFTSVPGGGANGQMIVNTSRGNSRAFVYKSLGGAARALSQPFAPAPPPFGAIPAENDFWTTGDTVQVFNLTPVNIVQIKPVFEEFSGGFDNEMSLYQLTGFSPGGIGASFTDIGNAVDIIECDFQTSVLVSPDVNIVGVFHNSAFECGVRGGPASAGPFGPAFTIIGGFFKIFAWLTQANIDGDTIFGTSGTLINGALGAVAVDTGSTLNVLGAVDMRSFAFYGLNVLYGAGTLNVQGQGRLAYPSGAGAAVAAFRLSPRILLNGVATGAAVASTGVITQGIATTAANIDTAAAAATGGIGGLFNFGGASIVNSAT